MSNPTSKARVTSTLAKKQKVPEALTTLDAVCNAGAQCTEVQGSPVAAHALTVLQDAVTTAHTTLLKKEQAALTLAALAKAMGIDFTAVKVAVRTYEVAVGAIAQGNAGVIGKAGLHSRVHTISQTALGKVSVVHVKPGKHSAESILTWPRGPGATGYAIEVNFTPQSPTGPWTALTSGTGRRRIVKAPAPGAQFLARVASLGTGGAQSDWSDPVLAVAAF
jgi:hypothetical protein